MTTELHLLVWSVILGLAHLVAASHFISHQYGYRWTAGNREEIMPPLKGMAGGVVLDEKALQLIQSSRGTSFTPPAPPWRRLASKTSSHPARSR